MAQEQMSDEHARDLALKHRRWYPGPFEALALTGAIEAGIATEIAEAAEHTDDAGRAELKELERYARGGHSVTATRGPQPGWPRRDIDRRTDPMDGRGRNDGP